ncbi:MAG: DNA polymerase III subunit delta, partial [Candidatus Latescibacteria bacterium]|nr:DNA polymerase III subunit delta [Candidatus Latescibacterota bacterium]
MTHTQLLASIKQGKIAPVYLLVGEETFQHDEAIRVLIEAVVDPAGRDFNLHVFYADEADPSEVANVAASYPLLAEKRMVVVKRAEKLTEAAFDTILPSLLPSNETTCLVFAASGVDFRRKGWGQVKNIAQVVEYKQIYDNKIPEWIERYVGEQGGRISREAARLLGDVVGNHLGELSGEIEKLRLVSENGAIGVE